MSQDEAGITNEAEQIEWQRKEAARQLSIILIKRGINCRIVTSSGYFVSSVLKLGMVNKNLSIYWRSKMPEKLGFKIEKLGCELTFVKQIVPGFVPGKTHNRQLDELRCIGLVFSDFKLQLECVDAETCMALQLCLQTLLSEVSSSESEKENNPYLNRLRQISYQIATQHEKQLQLRLHASFKQGAFWMFNYIEKSYNFQTKRAMMKWVEAIRILNMENMDKDKYRWRLHAIANMDIDLQAWYHCVFYDEVYRVRGPFWFREAALAVYRRSYDLVHNTLTALEESALAHVLCSTETSYGDVAGQMFTVQEIVDIEKFQLFQTLASTGITVTKYPRLGRPGKKVFRLSFVEGYIYLTWKGRFGNQGVELGKVSAVRSGICTDVTRKQGKPEKAGQYLSVISVGRSLDLYFETVEERARWQDLLTVLVAKETQQCPELRVMECEGATTFDLLVTYAAIGKPPSEMNQSIPWSALMEDNTEGDEESDDGRVEVG